MKPHKKTELAFEFAISLERLLTRVRRRATTRFITLLRKPGALTPRQIINDALRAGISGR